MIYKRISKIIILTVLFVILSSSGNVLAFSVGSGIHLDFNIDNSTDGNNATTNVNNNITILNNQTNNTINNSDAINQTNTNTNTNTSSSTNSIKEQSNIDKSKTVNSNTLSKKNDIKSATNDIQSDNEETTGMFYEETQNSLKKKSVSIDKSKNSSVALKIIAFSSTIVLLGLLIFTYALYRGKTKNFVKNTTHKSISE